MYRATDTEIEAFYLWLSGRFSKRQRENLLPVYVACPAERDTLLKDFLHEYNADHRFRAVKLSLLERSGKKSNK